MFDQYDSDCGCTPCPCGEPLPLCGECGGCVDCYEADRIVVRRLPRINPCDTQESIIRDLINSSAGSEPCTAHIDSLEIIGKTVTVMSTPTIKPLEYSEDGIQWQSSATFSNQPCGAHKYFVRQTNYPACIDGMYVVLSGDDCVCVPNIQDVTPQQTQCVSGFTQIRQTDGCGNLTWRITEVACGECVPNIHDYVPQQNRCIDHKVQILQTDGCGALSWRVTETACGECVTPTSDANVVPVSATCDSSNNILNNASFSLSNVNNSDGWGISVGSVYTGVGYGQRIVTINGGVISSNGMTGSSGPQIYTLRIWNTAQCFVDKVFTIPGTQCASTCIYPELTFFYVNPSCTGSVASNNGQMKAIFNGHATRYQIVQASTFNITPNYAAATPITPTYPNEMVVADNIGFTTGQAFKDYTIRTYNGNQTCYDDVTLRFPNPCIGGGGGCSLPYYTGMVANPGTCVSTTPQNNAYIRLTNVGNTTKFGYSVGTTYTGVNYASAIALSGSEVYITGLAGSASSQQYTVRQFNGSDACYTDIVVTIPGSNCTGSCVTPPTFVSKGAIEATCTGSTVNNDAQIQITGIANGTKYGYALGTTYVGPAYASATTFSGSSISVTNIAGSASATTYTFRIWNNSVDCYIDVTQVVPGKNCTVVCTTPIFTLASSAPTCAGSGASNNDGVLRIQTVSSGTSYQLCIASTFDCTPNFEGSIPISGSGPIVVLDTIGFISSQESRDFTVRVYNGAANCYQTHTITINNPCYACCDMDITSVTLTDV